MKKWIKGSIAALAVVCLFALPAVAVADASPRERSEHKEKNHDGKHHGKHQREDGFYEEEHHSFRNHCAVDYDEPCNRVRVQADCGSCDPCGTNLNFSPSNFAFISSSLFWSTCTNDLDFAVTGDFTAGTPTSTFADGRVHSIDLDYDYGFRLTGVYQFPCDCWELRVGWTHFNPSHSASASTSVDEPDLFVIGSFAADSISAYYKAEYDVLDFTIGKECCLCDKFSIRPYAGARFLWLDQRFRLSYEGDDFADEDLSTNNWRAEYNAGGIVGGIEGYVDVGCDFYLWGNFAASAVAGKLKMNQVIDEDLDAEVSINSDNSDNPDCIIATNFEAALGVGYKFACGCFDMDWRIGYEFVTWNNVPESNLYLADRVSSTTGGKHGSLGFHGVSVTTTTRF